MNSSVVVKKRPRVEANPGKKEVKTEFGKFGPDQDTNLPRGKVMFLLPQVDLVPKRPLLEVTKYSIEKEGDRYVLKKEVRSGEVTTPEKFRNLMEKWASSLDNNMEPNDVVEKMKKEVRKMNKNVKGDYSDFDYITL